MRAIIALCLMASAAQADPMTNWGLSTAVLSACPEADACLSVTNELSASPDVVDAALTLDGLTVALHVVMGIGERPDTVTVTVPIYFRVEPETATIAEGEILVFRIFAPLIG